MSNITIYKRRNFVFGGRVIKWFLLICVLTSCSENKLDIDVSGIELELPVQRMEQELFDEAVPLEKRNSELLDRYGDFYRFYLGNVLRVGNAEQPSVIPFLNSFVTDPFMKTTYRATQKAFPDVSFIQEDLEMAFKRYKFHFPDKPIPQILTFISGYNNPLMYTDKRLGISLDMYLGDTCSFYAQMPGLSQYQIRRMDRENIVADAVKGWVSTEFMPEKPKKELLNNMINEGKVLYLTDAILPNVPDSIKMGYSSEQISWCENFEVNMWAHFMEDQRLFITNAKDIATYMNDGPFTSAFPQESPARTGAWLGWQIVRAFMENNPKVTPAELIEITDAQAILNRSGYKPGKLLL